MEFKSIREILDFALVKEQASVQFYRDLASQMTDPSTRSLFEILVKNEQQHTEAIELEMEKLGYTVKIEPVAIDSTNRLQNRLEMNDEARTMNFIEALELAVQKERAAFRLYTQILGINTDPEFEKVLMELAEEEMRHVLQLEREYESITNRKV